MALETLTDNADIAEEIGRINDQARGIVVCLSDTNAAGREDIASAAAAAIDIMLRVDELAEGLATNLRAQA